MKGAVLPANRKNCTLTPSVARSFRLLASLGKPKHYVFVSCLLSQLHNVSASNNASVPICFPGAHSARSGVDPGKLQEFPIPSVFCIGHSHLRLFTAFSDAQFRCSLCAYVFSSICKKTLSDLLEQGLFLSLPIVCQDWQSTKRLFLLLSMMSVTARPPGCGECGGFLWGSPPGPGRRCGGRFRLLSYISGSSCFANCGVSVCKRVEIMRTAEKRRHAGLQIISQFHKKQLYRRDCLFVVLML